MALKKDIVLDLRIANDEAINAIAQLTKRIDELKIKRLGLNAEVKAGTITNEEYYKAIARLDAEMKEVNSSMKMYQKELSRNIAEEKLETGSLDQMRAQLKQLTAEYDALSQTDREAIGGVGEQKLLEIRRLTEELTEAEQASGRFQRAVGSYEDAIKNALNGTIPMRSAMREIQNNLQTLTLQYRQSAETIAQHRQQMEQIAQTQGTESQAYKDAQTELDRLQKAYQTTGQKLNEMTVQAGMMRDTMDDATKSIKSAAADNAGIKAMTEGAQLMADSYTILKASMKTLGIESDSLMDIFAKLQIVQQACNAVSRISNSLQKESILRQQAAILWNKLTTTSIATLTAAKKQDAVATATATTATTGLTAAEGAATAASGTLTVAIKAVGTAIKSIPVIGWILAAVAALGTLIGLIVKANKEDKEGQKLIEKKNKQIQETIELRSQAIASVEEEAVEIEQLIKHLRSCNEGTKDWKTTIGQIADALGVSESWLIKNKDKVEELAAAYVNMKKQMALADAFAKKVADERIKQAEIEAKIQLAMSNSKKERNKILDEMVETGELLAEEAKILDVMGHTLISSKSTAAEKDTARLRVAKETQAALQRVDRTANIYEKSMEEASEAAMGWQKVISEGLKENEKKNAATVKSAEDTAKKRIEIEQAYTKAALDILEDGLVKQLAVYKAEMDKRISEVKTKLAEVQKAEKSASGKKLADLRASEAALTAQMVILTEQRNKKIAEINAKYSREQLEKQLKNSVELLKIQKNFVSGDEAVHNIEYQIIQLQWEIDKQSLQNTIDQLNEQKKVFESLLAAPVEVQAEAAKRLGLTTEQYIESLQTDLQNTENQIIATENLIIAKDTENKRQLEKNEAEHQKKMADLRNNNASLEIDVQTAEALDALSQQMFANDAERELEKTRIKQEETQKRYELELQAYNNLVNLSEEEKSLLYDSHEAYVQATLEARKRVAEMHQQLIDSAKSVNTAQQNMVAQSFQTAEQVASAFGTVLSSISNLYNELASDNEEYNDFAVGLAMSQIMISMAVSIAQAVQAAVTAGGFTGPAAPVTIPVFISELLGIVSSSIASAVSTLKQAEQAKTPKPTFADGGLIGGKTTSGSIGRKDDVPIMASRGEFVVNADATRKHLKELIAINGGVGSSGYGYADGGIVAAASQQEMDYSVMVDSLTEAFSIAASEIRPEVSVREISKKQNRVKVKEQIAKQ